MDFVCKFVKIIYIYICRRGFHSIEHHERVAALFAVRMLAVADRRGVAKKRMVPSDPQVYVYIIFTNLQTKSMIRRLRCTQSITVAVTIEYRNITIGYSTLSIYSLLYCAYYDTTHLFV